MTEKTGKLIIVLLGLIAAAVSKKYGKVKWFQRPEKAR
jgi:hypothetical protein